MQSPVRHACPVVVGKRRAHDALFRCSGKGTPHEYAAAPSANGSPCHGESRLGCGYTVTELRRLQQYRLQQAEKFITSQDTHEKLRVLSTEPQELLSRPQVSYRIQSFRVGADYKLRKEEHTDNTLRADVAPLVHELPYPIRHVRISVPASVCRPLQEDDVSTSNLTMLQRGTKKQDESASIYSVLRPGRSIPKHLAQPKKSESFDIRRQAGVPNPTTRCDPEQFLYTPRARTNAGLAGSAVPNFRVHYEAAAKAAAAAHPRAGRFHARSCEELEKLSHLRAGLQVLHSRLWRRKNNPPLPERTPGGDGSLPVAGNGASGGHTVGERNGAGKATENVDGSRPRQPGGGTCSPHDPHWMVNSPFPNL